MSRPSWVVKQLADILGFDEATVTEAILPELESQQHQVRLQSHLQDFLGPSPQAKAFIEKYIALRFPSIAAPVPTPAPALKPTTTKSKAASGSQTPVTAKLQTASPSPDISKEITDAFGRKGVIYSKNALDPSPSGSRAHTPTSTHAPTHYRQAGRLTIHEAKMKPSLSDKGKSRAGAGSGKADKIWDLPKSAEVKRLEGIRDKLRDVQDGSKVSREVDMPDCFCQARVHPLSSYTPHCPHCGLIICELHPAYLPCPSCVSPLYSAAQLARLILRLGDEVETQLQSEQDDRDLQERERRERLIAASGGGAFPTLPGASASAPVTRPSSAEQSRKVLSIGAGSKGKGKGKATLTTTTYRTASPSTPTAEPTPSLPTDIVPRPRSPPVEASRRAKELDKILAWRQQEDRPWADVKGERRGEVWSYVEPPIVEMDEGREGRRRLAKKKKDEAKLRAIPGAA